MSQHDLDIANQTASNARADINNALQALGSLNSGTSAPATTYANMLWYDTTNNTLKMRSEADDVWISIGYLNQGSDAFRIFDNTQVVNTSGTQTGLIGDQATSAWQAGTSTTESLVSPAKVKSAIEGLVPTIVLPSAFSGSGTSSEIEMVDGYRGVRIDWTATGTDLNSVPQSTLLKVSLSTDSGSSWGTESTIASAGSGKEAKSVGSFTLDIDTGTYLGHANGLNIVNGGGSTTNGTVSGAGVSVNRIRIRATSSGAGPDMSFSGLRYEGVVT